MWFYRLSFKKNPDKNHVKGTFMFDEDPIAPKGDFKNLEFMSVAEIKEYITELEAEITRAKTDIDKKQASAAAADSVFKQQRFT